jgi:hypothetical protein
VADENLLGAIFANVEDTIEKTIQLIKEVTKQKKKGLLLLQGIYC